MKLNKTVLRQIESLTNNEDFKQDLWVAHLSGHLHLPTAFQNIKQQHEKSEKFQQRIHKYMLTETSVSMVQLLDNFSGAEKSILYMLLLGYKPNEIGDHYGTSPVRIHQAIHIIQKHSVWNELQTAV